MFHEQERTAVRFAGWFLLGTSEPTLPAVYCTTCRWFCHASVHLTTLVTVLLLLLLPYLARPHVPQITGQPSVLYYASQIFERAGFAGGKDAAGVAVLLGSFKLLMTLVAVASVDKLGRRPLLLFGVSGMVAALLALTAAQGGVDAANAAAAGGTGAAWLSAGALLVYVGCYQVGGG